MSVRILVVDDQPMVCRSLKRLLTSAGAEVVLLEEPSELELVALLAANAFDVVISDLQMPKMNGLEVLLKVEEHLPATRRLLLTANLHALTRAHLEEFEGVVIEKPWDDDFILSSLGLERR